MTVEELRQRMNDEGIPEHYINLICDPCEDEEEDGVVGRAWNIANDEGSYLKRLADTIQSWENEEE
jgi:hypothetical protein